MHLDKTKTVEENLEAAMHMIAANNWALTNMFQVLKWRDPELAELIGDMVGAGMRENSPRPELNKHLSVFVEILQPKPESPDTSQAPDLRLVTPEPDDDPPA